MRHAVFAPSSAATWLYCPWSASNAPAEELKPASTIAKADEGTRRHALLEDWHQTGNMPDADDDYEIVRLWKNFINKLEPGRQYSEYRVTLSAESWGTVDFYNIAPITTIMDFKNGVWDVRAEGNMQMLSYAAMELEHNHSYWWRFAIFQPNGMDSDEENAGFKQWMATRDEIASHRQRMLAAIAYTGGPKPGPHCRWCKSFQVCPAMNDDAGFMMGAMTRRIEDLTPDQIVRMLRLIRALGDVESVYKDALITHLKLGRTADGAKLEPKRSFRAWNDDIQAATYLYQQFGFKAVKPVSPAQAEKLGPNGKAYASAGSHKPEGEMTVKY